MLRRATSSASNRSFIGISVISKPTGNSGNCETPGSLQLHGCVTVSAQVDRVKREHGFVMKHALYNLYITLTLHQVPRRHTYTNRQKLKYAALSLLHSLCCHELLWVLQKNLIFNPFLLQRRTISLFWSLGLMFTTSLRDANCKQKICVRIWSSEVPPV